MGDKAGTEVKTETLEAIGAAGNKATILGGSVAVAGKLSAADLAAYVGAAVAVIGLLITWFYKREANKRQAADDILAQAMAWRGAQAQIRAQRLLRKEQARNAVDAPALDAVAQGWAAFVVAVRAQLGQGGGQ